MMQYLISERPQVLAGLQDALDDGHGVCQSLHLLQGVKNSHCLILKTGITLLSLYYTKTNVIEVKKMRAWSRKRDIFKRKTVLKCDCNRTYTQNTQSI